MDKPSKDKATCPECGHIAALGTVYCTQCQAIIDNAPLTVAVIKKADEGAREQLFKELDLV